MVTNYFEKPHLKPFCDLCDSGDTPKSAALASADVHRLSVNVFYSMDIIVLMESLIKMHSVCLLSCLQHAQDAASKFTQGRLCELLNRENTVYTTVTTTSLQLKSSRASSTTAKNS